MLSALKRLTNKNEASSNQGNIPRPPAGHQSMATSLQRKFARGVQYNMKIIIKGDRNVGKSCLFHRLQGQKFIEEYIPTDEIQVTCIHWNYKATDDVVKVEVWDVVDRGKKKKRFEGLKLENAQIEVPEETALDAEFLDVYKGTNGVIMMMDLTKSWTFDYVQREMPKVPGHIPVIILANHCDMSHHRTITADHVSYYIEGLAGSRSAQVRYAESSMRNGFGLKLLHKFFNLPFLQLQRETLLRQLERNERETALTVQELDMFFDSDEANYSLFLDNLVKRRREVADSNSNAQNLFNSTSQQPIQSQQQLQAQQAHAQNNSTTRLGGSAMPRSQSGPIVIGAGKPIPVPANKNGPVGGAKKDGPNLQGSLTKAVKEQLEDGLPDLKKLDLSKITSVEEFCPDGGQIDRSFLEDVQSSPQKKSIENSDTESDNETGNPLVAEYQDDLDPDDLTFSSRPFPASRTTLSEAKPPPATATATATATAKTTPSSGENEAEKKQQATGEDYDMKPLVNDEFDSTINSEISEITSEAFDIWLSTDSKWRRSPEGGEDVSTVSQTLDYSGSTMNDDSSITSSNIHMELLSGSKQQSQYQQSSDGDSEKFASSVKKEKKRRDSKDKSEKKSSKSKKSKEKESKSSEKKKSKRRSLGEGDRDKGRDELEEFLNGNRSPVNDSAYEAI